MPANDQLSGANPADFRSTAPAKDTTFSNSAARLKSPHHARPDADGNGAFHDQSKKKVQFPVGELAVRAQGGSATP